jgi:hypothetical protein
VHLEGFKYLENRKIVFRAASAEIYQSLFPITIVKKPVKSVTIDWEVSAEVGYGLRNAYSFIVTDHRSLITDKITDWKVKDNSRISGILF